MTVTRSRSISHYPSPCCGSMRRGEDEANTRLTHTFPTAASPSKTSLTLLLGFGGAAAESAMVVEDLCRYTNGRAEWPV